MFAQEIRRAIEAAPRITLPNVAALLWRAYGEGQLSEDEATTLSELIELRKVFTKSGGNPRAASDRVGSPRKAVGSRPRTDASMERRRRWAASGRLPPALAARFTLAEQAVLALVAAETARRGDCRLAVGHVAAIVGVSETTVRNAIRQARTLGLVTVEERQITGFRNDTNIVRIVSPEWSAWLRLGRKAPGYCRHGNTFALPLSGGGVKSSTSTPTEVLERRGKRSSTASQGLPEGSGRPEPRRHRWNRQAG